jgi:flagellar hook-length control protein FliK
VALPVHLDAIAASSDVPALEAQPTEVHAAARVIAPAAAQQPAEISKPERPVEAPARSREPQLAHDTERAADILRQVRVHIVPRTSEAYIQLEPRELGRVSIHVAVEDGKMRASVRAEKREALDAIQAHLPELRATLRDSGIRTQEFHFGLGLENQPRRENQQSGNRPSHPHAPAVDARDPEHAVLLRAVAAASGVDLYA